MADIDFPSLPSPVGGQFSEGFLETKVQDQGEVGSPRQRNRFTRGLARFSFQMLLTGAQRSALAGVNRFNWTHPTTAVVYEAIMPSRPSIKHMTADLWTADVEIEEV